MKKIIVLLSLGLVCLAFMSLTEHTCNASGSRISAGPFISSFTPCDTANRPVYVPDKPYPIPPGSQRTGDAAQGYTYLTTGDYLKSGIPYSYFLLGFGRDKNNYLHRDSVNDGINYDYTAVKAQNGEIVVAPNCLQCHAQVFENKLYIGLGNSMIDFTDRKKLNARNAILAESILKKGDLRKYTAAAPFLQAMKAIGDELYTQVRGVNSADRLADLLVAHRDPATLRWRSKPVIDVSGQVIPTDTPPWWLLKKKNAMFYNGFGRGDFGRFLMASNLLTVNDSSEAREVDSHFNDVLAYIYSLKPPKYPHPINSRLAKQGGALFVEHCSKCHGNSSDYPNLLIPESMIGTDSVLYKSNYQTPQFIGWFNESWFSKGDHPARLEPYNGYIAPPLDGIWITAPYLHNGSVPNLEALFDSKTRPAYWSRDFNKPEYDYEKVGWKYTAESASRGTEVYDTHLPGYGNYGHTYGDRLTPKERKAVLEFLKTL